MNKVIKDEGMACCLLQRACVNIVHGGQKGNKEFRNSHLLFELDMKMVLV